MLKAFITCFSIYASVVTGFRLSSCNSPRTRFATSQLSSTSIKNQEIFQNFYIWLQKESISSLVPQEDLIQVITEVRGNKETLDDLKVEYEKIWDYFENEFRNEKRTLKQLLGKGYTEKLLSAVEKADVYDPATVRAFIQTPVFEDMLGGILYEGIFEFLQRVDILGNIVNNLPIIGPIRQTIVKEFKISLDKTLGGQIKGFLSSFNKVAVQRMADYVLSPKNRISFSKANSRFLDAFISREVSSIVSNKEANKQYKVSLWSIVTNTPISEFQSILDNVYSNYGNIVIAQYTPKIDFFLKLIGTTSSIDRLVEKTSRKFLSSEEGKQSYIIITNIMNEIGVNESV
jgi:hypothetical protein